MSCEPIIIFLLTKIRPVVVWPDISSPAQSLASVIKVPSNSCLPRLAFCSFCLGSFGDSSGSLRQHMNAKARQRRTIRSPAKNVKMLDKRKHHHFRTWRQSSKGASVVINSSSQPDIPYQIVTGIFCYFMSFTFINHWTSLSPLQKSLAGMLSMCGAFVIYGADFVTFSPAADRVWCVSTMASTTSNNTVHTWTFICYLVLQFASLDRFLCRLYFTMSLG